MAFGSWFAGKLYDHFGYYAPAFGSGVAFNIANLCIIGFLIVITTRRRGALAVPAIFAQVPARPPLTRSSRAWTAL